MNPFFSTPKIAVVTVVLGLLAFRAGCPPGGNGATGTILYKTTTLTVNHAALVKGPDAIDPKLTIRRLIFSAKDLRATLTACKAMNCTDGSLDEGLTVDLDAGPRLNYWLVLNGQRVQYSGTVTPDALTLTTRQPDRLAGTLRFDGTPAAGPKVDVTFDATLLKTFAAAR